MTLISKFEPTKTMKNIAYTSFVSIIYLSMGASHYKQTSKQFKQLFKSTMGQQLVDYKDTEFEDLLKQIFTSEDQNENLEQLYQY